jgi:hypothetical protein
MEDPHHLTTLQVPMACYRDSFTSLYVDDVRTSLEAHAFAVCYGHSFSSLYVNDVRTS